MFPKSSIDRKLSPKNLEENNDEVIVHIENPKESVQKLESKKENRTIK